MGLLAALEVVPTLSFGAWPLLVPVVTPGLVMGEMSRLSCPTAALSLAGANALIFPLSLDAPPAVASSVEVSSRSLDSVAGVLAGSEAGALSDEAPAAVL